MKYSIITSTYNQRAKIERLAKVLSEITDVDFEWIVADDGSSDDTLQWLETNFLNKTIGGNPITVVTQQHDGYGLVSILNKAGAAARGDYLLWIMADTYPAPGFFAEFDPVVKEDRMVCAVRLNYNERGLLAGPDWRLLEYPVDSNLQEIEVVFEKPWGLMTLNGMCMSRKAWNEMGGICPEYKGYGKMDWDMAAWCFYHNYKLVWATRAFLRHDLHTDREDTAENTELFKQRLKLMQEGKL